MLAQAAQGVLGSLGVFKECGDTVDVDGLRLEISEVFSNFDVWRRMVLFRVMVGWVGGGREDHGAVLQPQ